MDMRSLSERDICTKFITPVLRNAGWDEMLQIREEVSFTKGRIIVRGSIAFYPSLVFCLDRLFPSQASSAFVGQSCAHFQPLLFSLPIGLPRYVIRKVAASLGRLAHPTTRYTSENERVELDSLR